jgi:ribosome biogenesis GTPase
MIIDLALERLGWDSAWEEAHAPFAALGLRPARVVAVHRDTSIVRDASGDRPAAVSGAFRYAALAQSDFPTVGDWVALDAGDVVAAILPRRSVFKRMATDASRNGARLEDEQIMASNVEVALLVAGLDNDFNLRRIERYLVLAWESGAEPVVVLTKSDLHDDVEGAVAEVAAVAIGVPTHAVSNVTGEGVDDLRPYFTGNRTVAALGSSGVGKSTLINSLSRSEVAATGEVRQDGRGRHTTTRRELLAVPGGGFFLDTPGMREIQLSEASTGVEETFDDVSVLAAQCRFSDCAHEAEPGCAVQEALHDRRLDPDRWASYRKLQRELAALERKLDARAKSEERKKWRRFSKAQRKDAW